MQKVSYNTRSHARLPLLDLTNIRANEHLMSKPLATSKNESRSGISNFLVPSCAIDLARCSHASTIKSVSASASNCADCGALVTSVTKEVAYGCRKECVAS